MAPRLDHATVARLAEVGGPELVVRVVDRFLETVPLRLEQCRQALERGDAKAAEQPVHSVKGSAGLLGARRLEAMARRVEEELSAGPTEAAGALLAKASRECEAVAQVLRQLRESHSSNL